MATLSSPSTGSRSRFSNLLSRKEVPSLPPAPPPKELAPPSASFSSSSLPRTSSPTSRFRRPSIPLVHPPSSSSYSFTSSPSLEGGPNSPILPTIDPPSPRSTSYAPSPATSTVGCNEGRSLPYPTHPPTIIKTAAPGLSSSTNGSLSPPSSNGAHVKGKKSFSSFLRRPSSTTNLSFRSVEDDDLIASPQRTLSSSLPPRTPTQPSSGWNIGDPPLLVPMNDEPRERAATLGRSKSKLKRKGSQVLNHLVRKSSSAALKGDAGASEPERRKTSFASSLQGGDQEDDTGVGTPFNVRHELHIDSEELTSLPPEWVELLRAQGLSTTELLQLARDKSRSASQRSAAQHIPISQYSHPLHTIATALAPPHSAPQLPPFSHVFLTPESPPPPPLPLRSKESSRLSLQIRDFRGIEIFAQEEEDGGWAQGLLSAAMGSSELASTAVAPSTRPLGGETRVLLASPTSSTPPSDDRPPLTPREQRLSRLAKKGAGRRPSDPSSSGGEGGGLSSRSASPKKSSSTFSHGASSSGGTSHHPVTPLPPPGSYVPPSRKDSRPASARSISSSSVTSLNGGLSLLPSSSLAPNLSPPRPLPLLPPLLITAAPFRRPLPSLPVEPNPAPSRLPTPPPLVAVTSSSRPTPERQTSASSSNESDAALSTTFGMMTGQLMGGRRTPDMVDRREEAEGKNVRSDDDEVSEEEGPGQPYLDEFGTGGTPLEKDGGTFGNAGGRNASSQLASHRRTDSESSQVSVASLVPSLNGDSSIANSSASNHHLNHRPSLQRRTSSSFSSSQQRGSTHLLDPRLSVATAATGTSRVTSLSPSLFSSGSHLSLDEEAIISRAIIVPSSISASATTTHFASSSLNRPTKPVRLFLGGSNGSSRELASSSPHSPVVSQTFASLGYSPKQTLSSAGSQQSMFEEAELALDEAVKQLHSPKRWRDGDSRASEAEQPTTPGTPAYSDFLHEFGSEEEGQEEEGKLLAHKRRV